MKIPLSNHELEELGRKTLWDEAPLPIMITDICTELIALREEVKGLRKAVCQIHPEVKMSCPACAGSITSARKAVSSRENGKLGGRPKGGKGKRKVKN